MKTLNTRAVKILTALLEKGQLKTDHSDKEVQAKVIHDFGRYRIINLTLLRNEGGFQWREPEITILHDTLTDEYIPLTSVMIMHISIPIQQCIYGGQLTVHNEKIQSDHTEFAHRMLESITEQL